MQIPPWKWRQASPVLPPSPITFALLKPPVASDRCRSLNLQHRRTPSSEAAHCSGKEGDGKASAQHREVVAVVWVHLRGICSGLSR